MFSRIYFILFVISFSLLAESIHAEQIALKHFVAGSYKELLNHNANKPLILTIWSTTCSSCLQKLPVLNELRKNRPDIDIVMISTDDISSADQIQAILKKYNLTHLENWAFADHNEQKLRFEIDPKWFGELPRTYFLNKQHNRAGISGALSLQDHLVLIDKILD